MALGFCACLLVFVGTLSAVGVGIAVAMIVTTCNETIHICPLFERHSCAVVAVVANTSAILGDACQNCTLMDGFRFTAGTVLDVVVRRDSTRCWLYSDTYDASTTGLVFGAGATVVTALVVVGLCQLWRRNECYE
jgi:hypothetical protein